MPFALLIVAVAGVARAACDVPLCKQDVIEVIEVQEGVVEQVSFGEASPAAGVDVCVISVLNPILTSGSAVARLSSGHDASAATAYYSLGKHTRNRSAAIDCRAAAGTVFSAAAGDGAVDVGCHDGCDTDSSSSASCDDAAQANSSRSLDIAGSEQPCEPAAARQASGSPGAGGGCGDGDRGCEPTRSASSESASGEWNDENVNGDSLLRRESKRALMDRAPSMDEVGEEVALFFASSSLSQFAAAVYDSPCLTDTAPPSPSPALELPPPVLSPSPVATRGARACVPARVGEAVWRARQSVGGFEVSGCVFEGGLDPVCGLTACRPLTPCVQDGVDCYDDDCDGGGLCVVRVQRCRQRLTVGHCRWRGRCGMRTALGWTVCWRSGESTSDGRHCVPSRSVTVLS